MTEFLGAEYASALNMILLLLPGTPTTYYGEEIAMRPIHVTYEETQDPVGKYFGPVSTSEDFPLDKINELGKK